jgi:Ca2+-binding EF-hand superfamily protein
VDYLPIGKLKWKCQTSADFMEAVMLRSLKIIWIVLAIAAVIATGALIGAAAAKNQPDPKLSDKQALAQEDVKQLLLLMDADKNGKISKQEWMNFMAAEFDRLDTDKSGELDIKELTQSGLRPTRFAGR